CSSDLLNMSEISKYIYLLKNKMKTLAKKDFLISGNAFEISYLTKLLLLADAQTVTILQEDEKDSLKQVERLSTRLTDTEAAKVFAATSKSLYYRLSKTDAVICDFSKIDLFNKKMVEEIAIMRQTKKIQYLIDTSKQPIKEMTKDNLDIHVIDPTINVSYNDEQLNNAIIVLEEEIQTRIEKFMKHFEELRMNKEQKITQ